ncbi:MAG: polysaccharide deacetylase family protein [Bacteroidota bacterium]
MKIAVIINDKRINNKQISYLVDNFRDISICNIVIIGPFGIDEIKNLSADCYLVYGEENPVSKELPTIIIPYCNYTNQLEEYVFLESGLRYTGMEIANRLPILKYSIVGEEIEGIRNENQIRLNFDLFWNCFFHMSLYREYLYEEKHGDLGSYFNKLKVPAEVIEIPVVNCLFSMLENLLSSFLAINYRNDRQFSILLTHDIDALFKTLLNRSKQALFYGYNGLRKILSGQIKPGFSDFGKAAKHFITPANYSNIDEIIKLDHALKVQSIFFIYSKERNINDWFKYWIFDPQYDIAKKRIRNILLELHDKTVLTGLHASFSAYQDFKKYQRELTILTTLMGPVEWNRNHWLKFSVHDTFDILEQAGIKNDSTLGFNDQTGFRSGLCTPYFPYNFKEEKAYEIREYPLNIMDCTLFNYLRLNNDEALKKAKNIKQWVKVFDGVLTLNWHNHVYSSDYNWHLILKDLIGDVK